MPLDDHGHDTPSSSPPGHTPAPPHRPGAGGDSGGWLVAILLAIPANVGMWFWATHDFDGWQIVVAVAGVVAALAVIALVVTSLKN